MTERFRPDVMLLAAGLGKRMMPLTATTPKPLIPVAGAPLIDHVIAAARAEGLDHFVVNTHHHADQLEWHLAGFAGAGAKVRISRETSLLNTGGGIVNALPLIETDPFLVMNTDSFWPAGADRPIARLIERADESAIVLLCVHLNRARGFRRGHDFCLDPHGNITKDRGAPVIYAGTALVRRSVFDRALKTPFSFYTLIEAALEAETLVGVVLDAPWLHVGDPQALAEAEALLTATA